MSKFYIFEEEDYVAPSSDRKAPDGYAFGEFLAKVILWGAAIIIPIWLFW